MKSVESPESGLAPFGGFDPNSCNMQGCQINLSPHCWYLETCYVLWKKHVAPPISMISQPQNETYSKYYSIPTLISFCVSLRRRIVSTFFIFEKKMAVKAYSALRRWFGVTRGRSTPFTYTYVYVEYAKYNNYYISYVFVLTRTRMDAT